MRSSKPLALTPLLLLAVIGIARAEVLKIERPIRLPDGKPAAGVRVILRSLNIKDGTLKEEKRVVADEQGIVRAEINIDPDDSWGDERSTGYMIVDSPGLALTFERFNAWRRRLDVAPLSLGAGYELKGKVLTRQDEPVAGAEVMLAAFTNTWANWRIHYPAAGIKTPEATTRTKDDGSFELRPVFISTAGSGEAVLVPLLVVSGAQGGATLSGSGEVVARKAGTSAPDTTPGRNTIRVAPTSTLRGQVVNEVDARPVAGAQIMLREYPDIIVAAAVPPVTSNGDGKFEIRGVPAFHHLFAIATHPDFAQGWKRIGEYRMRITDEAPLLTDEAPLLTDEAPLLYENIELRVQPLLTLRGRIVDAGSNAPPVTPMTILASYGESYRDQVIGIEKGFSRSQMNEDGTFTIKLPIGDNRLTIRGPGYLDGYATQSVDVTVRPTDNPELKIQVKRQLGYFVHFDSPLARGEAAYDYNREYDLFIHGADGKEAPMNLGEWWYRPIDKPDETLEIRVTRFVDGYAQEVVPWTRLTPQSKAPGDARHWPRRIHLPLRQTVTICGRVVEAETGKPVPDAIVKLISRPAEAVKKLAPITTAADGTFTFERVPLPTELSVTVSLPATAGHPASAGTTQVGQTPLMAVSTDADEGHQEFKDVVVTLPQG